MSDAVAYEVRGGVAYVRIDRPDAMNACDAVVRAGLRESFEQAGADDAVRSVVLTGTGRAFCVGQDLKELEPLYASGSPELGNVVTEFNAVVAALASVGKPTVAAVNGAAAGAGVSLALACDLRVAVETASFTLAFSRIGLVPDTGGSWTLPRVVGAAKALELMLLSPTVKADEALRLGLVTRVVAADAFEAAVEELAAGLAAGPTLAYGWTRRLVDAAATSTFAEALGLENELQATAGRTEDHRAAVAAFLAKRPPEFRGR